MKGIYYIWMSFLTILLCTCQKQTYTLPTALDQSQIAFEVLQDLTVDAGGNTVILINNTDETISYWNYGFGQSNRQRDTIRFPFQGTYEIAFSALTGGGLVEMDPVTIEVTEDNLNYVNDPLWIALSGGPGNEKTWILDIDNHFFEGPLYFYGTDNGWSEGGDDGCYGEDCWNWNPVYAEESWLMPYGDYGTMTFSLIDGPRVVVDHLMLPHRGTERGTYNLNVNEKTLTLNGVSPLHDEAREGCVANWGNIRLMSLTEDSMQLAVLRRASCDSEALLVYNYVSKDFADAQNTDE